MIMLRDILVLFLLAESRRFPDHILARAGVERREADLRKLELIRAIKSAFLRLAVWIHHSALFRSGGGQHIVQIGSAEADVLDIARFSPGAEAIHVDIG